MSKEIVIITPEITPGGGGLADYSLRLVQEWGARGRARFVRSKEGLTSHDHVLVQYSAYGYSRRGYPRGLLRDLRRWRETNQASRLVLMLHEIWSFTPFFSRDRLLQWLHRSDLAQLVRAADAVFTSTPTQAEHLNRLKPKHAVEVLPVGSNIPVVADIGAPREPGVAILFGQQANRIRTLRALRGTLGSLHTIISCGGGNSPAGNEEERALASVADFQQRGPVSVEEASRLFARATFALWAQDPMSIHKSGTFMACAAHRLNIVSPSADLLGPEPFCWLTNPRELAAGLPAEELRSRAQQLQEWEERTASWPAIAQRLGDALHLPS